MTSRSRQAIYGLYMTFFVIACCLFSAVFAGNAAADKALNLIAAPAYVLGPGQMSGRFMLTENLQAMFFIEKQFIENANERLPAVDDNGNQLYVITLRFSNGVQGVPKQDFSSVLFQFTKQQSDDENTADIRVVSRSLIQHEVRANIWQISSVVFADRRTKFVFYLAPIATSNEEYAPIITPVIAVSAQMLMRSAEAPIRRGAEFGAAAANGAPQFRPQSVPEIAPNGQQRRLGENGRGQHLPNIDQQQQQQPQQRQINTLQFGGPGAPGPAVPGLFVETGPLGAGPGPLPFNGAGGQGNFAPINTNNNNGLTVANGEAVNVAPWFGVFNVDTNQCVQSFQCCCAIGQVIVTPSQEIGKVHITSQLDGSGVCGFQADVGGDFDIIDGHSAFSAEPNSPVQVTMTWDSAFNIITMSNNIYSCISVAVRQGMVLQPVTNPTAQTLSLQTTHHAKVQSVTQKVQQQRMMQTLQNPTAMRNTGVAGF